MRVSTSGGFAFGNSYYSTDPGVNNLIIQGNVGIGTTEPSARLDVIGNIRIAGSTPSIITDGNSIIFPNGANVSGGTLYAANEIKARRGISNDTATYLSINGGTGSVTYFNGNVGVGYTSPSQNSAYLVMDIFLEILE